ncbi:MAG TPA: hypothetical protein VJU61_24730, partial [Polyangiaceae bacterium]|nr:hypothetical protein [Polyangiaceae bacterium]
SEGVLSTLFSQLLGLAPVAGRGVRACLVGVLALAGSSWLVFRMLSDVLEARRPFRLNAFLALLASQLWATSPLVQHDAVSLGSSAPSLALILLGMRLVQTSAPGDVRGLALSGLLLGLTAGESQVAAGLLFLALLVHFASGLRQVDPGRELPPRDAGWIGFVGSLALGWGLCWLVPLSRARASSSWIDLGIANLVSATAVAPSGGRSPHEIALEIVHPFFSSLGPLALGLGLSGAVLALGCRALRRPMLLWWILTGTALLLPLASSTQTRQLLELGSSLGVVAFVPLALQAALSWLWSQPVPFARPASVLTVVFAVTLVLQRLESVAGSEPAAEFGAEVWTEQALGRLPPRSVVLVQSPALGLRLLAAQVQEGTRLDVLSVPVPLLHRGSVAEQLLARAPELGPLLRQILVNGAPDEYALCRLADARPLFLEIDASWDARLLEHLRPEPLWLGFSAHALGKSERQAGVRRSRAALRRWLTEPDLQRELNPSTRRLLAQQTGQQALALTALGDSVSARQMLRVLHRLEPGDALAAELQARLDSGERGRASVSDVFEAVSLRLEPSDSAP